jgi:uroporphyrinogen III methyltransferase/synthase
VTARPRRAAAGRGPAGRRPLEGRRVLVTRAADQAAEFIALLDEHGAVAVEAPMIRIAPPEDTVPLDTACRRLPRFDWIVFSSVNAVEALVARVRHVSGDLRNLEGPRLCAVGSATAERLTRYGLKVGVVPAEYRAEALAEALARTRPLRGVLVLVPRSDIGRDVVARELTAQGAEVTEVVAYRTIAVDPARDGGPDVRRLLLDGRLDAVTFTSTSAVENLVRVLGGSGAAADLLGRVAVACIGPVTADAAARHHVRTDIVPAEYTVPALVAALGDWFARPPDQG